MSSLFVGNLSSHVRRREFENAFRRFGRCNLDLKEGYGFVIFEDHRDARRALEALQGRSLCGEQPSLSWARKRRPYQRFPGKGKFEGREMYSSRRRPSLEADQRSDEGRRDENLDELKGGLRANEAKDEPVIGNERDAEWTNMGPEKSSFDGDMKDADPLDSGRWDPHMEGSPDNALVEKLLEDEQHHMDDRDKGEESGNAYEKSPGSPREKHHDRPSRTYRNLADQYKRGRETFGGRQQERCYNCGKSGHVKWQCRSRSRRISVQTREGVYDGRRNDLRYPGNRGGFRGTGSNGRFRGSNPSRRMLTRNVEPSYGRKNIRRHDLDIDRKRSDRVDDKTSEKSRRRRHRSESPGDLSTKGRSKKKHKISSKKSTRSSKKRKRSSSGSSSRSRSPRSISSSPPRSRSVSDSKSHSSKSGSQSSDARSQSRSFDSHYSRSRSSSASSSRSRSTSGQSGKSDSKSRSKSPSSNSHISRDISSPSPNRKSSAHMSSSGGGSQSSRHGADKEVGTPCRHESDSKEPYAMPSSDDEETKGSLKYHQCDAKRIARREVWSLEIKKQQIHITSDDKPRLVKSDPQSNGVFSTVKAAEAESVQQPAQQCHSVNDSCIRDEEDWKGSEANFQGRASDIVGTSYATMKEAGRVAGGIQDWGNLRFDAARLWPWEAILNMRFKRGPISSENYERRKAQNEEFGIKDTFVRSSSGWWEIYRE